MYIELYKFMFYICLYIFYIHYIYKYYNIDIYQFSY